MFGHLFFVVIGFIGFVLGLQEQDYVWAEIGFLVAVSSVYSLYQLKTGKSLFSSKD